MFLDCEIYPPPVNWLTPVRLRLPPILFLSDPAYSTSMTSVTCLSSHSLLLPYLTSDSLDTSSTKHGTHNQYNGLRCLHFLQDYQGFDSILLHPPPRLLVHPSDHAAAHSTIARLTPCSPTGDIPSFKLFESDKVFAFLDIQPLSRGHAVSAFLPRTVRSW